MSESESYESSSQSSSDSENTFDTSESENEDVDELQKTFNGLKLEAFQFEPTKHDNENENVILGDETEVYEVQEQQNQPTAESQARIGNLNWCSCTNCKIETREIDCLCCKEVDAISDEQFDGK